MRLRRSAAAVSGLLVLLPALAACGDEETAVEVGDVVQARQDDQFLGGTGSSLVLPIGRLEVRLGEPTEELAGTDTRERTAVAAPDGSTFLPITWQYDADTFHEHEDYLGQTPSPVVDLLSDGATYRLPPPEEVGEGSESFYVAVSGPADDAVLRIEFDGVEQTVDLVTGEREEGDATALYDVDPAQEGTRSCKRGADFNDTPGLPDYRCKVSRLARLPYANGEWAEPGRTWLVVSVTTALRRYDLLGTMPGSGALYAAGAVESDFRIGEREPVGVLEDPDGACPDIANQGCTAIHHVVFDVPQKSRPVLRIEQTWDLILGFRWGGFVGDDEMDLDVSVRVPLR